MALGSCSVLLEYIRPGPGMPCFMRYAWELGRLLIFGMPECGSNVGGLCLVLSFWGHWMLACVFKCWMIAFMSHVLMVSVGIGSW